MAHNQQPDGEPVAPIGFAIAVSLAAFASCSRND